MPTVMMMRMGVIPHRLHQVLCHETRSCGRQLHYYKAHAKIPVMALLESALSALASTSMRPLV